MISELRETNKKLREKLEDLQKESNKLCAPTQCQRSTTNTMLDSSFSSPSCWEVKSDRRIWPAESQNTMPVPSSGRYTSLSDKAKHVRGEASRRIDSLLRDWRDFKEKADEELRRKQRTEQNLRDMLSRKERELSDMSREVASMKLVSDDQRQMITQLTEEIEMESKCRNRCADLEMQIAKLNRNVSELNEEVRVRDELLRSNEAERDSLTNINAELRDRSHEQKMRIESCQQEVNETRMELEMLEEIVRALNERQVNLFRSRPNSRSATPNNVDFASTRLYTSPATPPCKQSAYQREDVLPTSYNPSTISDEISTSKTQNDRHTPGMVEFADDPDRILADRASAMTTLKSLQKEHTEKCNYLAEHIRKLKEQNKDKERTISDLKSSSRKISP